MTEQETIVFNFAQEYASFLSWLREHRELLAQLLQGQQVDLGPVLGRIEALEQKPQYEPAGVDLSPIVGRIEALEKKPAKKPDLSGVYERLEQAEQTCKEALTTLEQIRVEIASGLTGNVAYDDRQLRERVAALEEAVQNVRPVVVFQPAPEPHPAEIHVPNPDIEEVTDGNAG